LNPASSYICHSCGKKHGRHAVPHEGATWHLGDCDYCGAIGVPVAEPRDYGGLRRAGEGSANTRLISQVMDQFDFELVHKAMRALDWRWLSPGSPAPGSLEAPTISQIKQKARSLLTRMVAKPENLGMGDSGFMVNVLGYDIGTGAFDGLSLQFTVEKTYAYFDEL
jgi:hypothetical protein